MLVLGLAVCVVAAGAGARTAADDPLALLEPADIVVVGTGIVVTDRKANAVFRIDATTGEHRVLARVVEARELAAVEPNAVLVTSGARIRRVDLSTGVVTPVARAAKYVLGLVRSPSGDLFVSEDGTIVVRIDSRGRRTVLVRGRSGIHGLLLRGRTLFAAEAYAGNVLAIDLATRKVRLLARRLGNPSFLASAPAGGLYVSEFASGRISLRRADGSLRTVVRLAQVGPIAVEPAGTLLAATLDGRLVRVDPGTRRITQLIPAPSG